MSENALPLSAGHLFHSHNIQPPTRSFDISAMKLSISLIVAFTFLSQSHALVQSNGNTLNRGVPPAEAVIPELRTVKVSVKSTSTVSSKLIG